MRAILLAALALSACAGPHYLTKACISKEQLAELEHQAPPKVKDKLTGDAQKDVKILAGNLIRRGAYEQLLLDSLRVCAS